jgi:hypothetical protein
MRLGLAGPFAKHDTQLVGLLLQLAHPFRLHGQIATDFGHLAFDGIGQLSGSEPPVSPPRARSDPGLPHGFPLWVYILPVWAEDVCTVWNRATPVVARFGVCRACGRRGD